MSVRQHLYWSIRRELWEHRSLWIAPMAIAALILAAFVIATDKWSALLHALPALQPSTQTRMIYMPYGLAASVILLAGWLVAIGYALDALNAERRDRSILFWKSMPVSDVTTVLAKGTIALAIVPLIAIAIALATQLLMLVASSGILATKGLDPGMAWTRVPWLATSAAMVYGMAAHALWFAPIFGYLLLISAAVPRAPFLWAFLPIFAAGAVERIAFGTTYVATLLYSRVFDGMSAFKPDALEDPITELSQLDPVRFVSMPGLWLGLAFAVACLAAAIRLRRYREPI